MKYTKIILRISIFAVASLFPFSSNAVITYGESNLLSEVDYQNPENTALTSVVAVSDSSAVHLGNGWFLTANHVSLNSSVSVSQNGQTAKISYVDNTLNSSYGADLKLFYVEDYQSLTSLSSVSIAPQDAYASLETTTFGYSSTGNIITGYTYDLTYERGTLITIAGAGFGRDDSAAIDAETVSSNGLRGTVHAGESSLFTTQTTDGFNYLITMAETETGSAQALTGDSGGGMFVYFEDEWYIVGTITSVYPSISTSTAIFGSYDEAKLTYGSDGRPTGIDPSALYENSLTLALNLEEYADTINAIIATTPVPEPAETAFLAALSVIAAIAAVKRKR